MENPKEIANEREENELAITIYLIMGLLNLFNL